VAIFKEHKANDLLLTLKAAKQHLSFRTGIFYWPNDLILLSFIILRLEVWSVFIPRLKLYLYLLYKQLIFNKLQLISFRVLLFVKINNTLSLDF